MHIGRLGIGAVTIAAALELSPAVTHARSLHMPTSPTQIRFDWPAYEFWTRAHHRAGIPLTRFAWPWMTHRNMCGGAMTGEIFNRRDISFIQDFERCWAVQTVLQRRPEFKHYPTP